MASASSLTYNHPTVKAKSTAAYTYSNLQSLNEKYVYVTQSEVHLVNCADKSQAAVYKVNCADKDTINQVAFCGLRTGPQIFVATSGGSVYSYDETGQKSIGVFHMTASQVGVVSLEANLNAMTHDGESILFVGSSSGEILQLSATDKRLALSKKFIAHPSGVGALVYSTSHSLLVSGDEAGAVTFWSHMPGSDAAPTKVKEFKGEGQPATSAATANGLVAVGFANGKLRIFNAAAKTLLAEISAHARAITAVDMNAAGLVAAVSEDTHLSVWSTSDGKIASILSKSVLPAVLVGVRFAGKEVAVTAFDHRYLHFISLP